MKDEESIPGNYVPTDDPNQEPDTDMAEVIVKDPAGRAVTYIGLGLVSLTMIVIGVILIKKKVLTA